MAARAASPDTSANSGSAFHAPRRGSSCASSSSSAPPKPGASSSAPDAPEVPARDMSQIKRLSYLLDAREARVQMVLDEAMSWLITPFAPPGEEGPGAGPAELQGKDAKANEAEAKRQQPGMPEGNAQVSAAAVHPTPCKDQGMNTLASADAQRLKAASQGNQLAADSQPHAQQTQTPRQSSEDDVQTPPQLPQHTATQQQPVSGSGEESLSFSGGEASAMLSAGEPAATDCSLAQEKATPKADVPQAGAAQASQQAGDPSAASLTPAPEAPLQAAAYPAQPLSEGAAFSGMTASGEQAAASQAEEDAAVSAFGDKDSLFLRDLSFFSLEELEKLEAESAWDELDADDERYAGDYCLPLLPRLVAASPSLSSGSRLDLLKGSEAQASPVSSLNATAGGVSAGAALGASAVLAAAGGVGAAGGAVDSPKRKRGRPKGSGKKAKARLEAAASGVLLGGPFKGLEHSESSGFLHAGGNSPSLVVGYGSQSPGSSSALTNSPTSLWSSGADTFHSLADLLDISGESSGLPAASNASLASPATPSSGTSNMLRSCSTASSAGSAMLPVPEESTRDGLSLVSPRTSARSARLNNGGHARRLMFGVEEEAPEDAAAPAVPARAAPLKDSKKSSKGKTGRPRGRPRKIRPHERVRPAGEQV